MHRKLTAVAFVFILLISTVSCTVNSKDKFSVRYGTGENGVFLKKFTGTSTDLTFTVEDMFEGKPVVELADFSAANSEYLQVLNIGAHIKIISRWSFTNCPQLKSINVSKENSYFVSLNGVLFSRDMKTLLSYPNKNSKNYTIPQGVETIAENAFYKCDNIEQVTLPDSLKNIENRAFHGCVKLNRIVLGSKVEKIGTDAFSFCTALKAMFIPVSVKIIGDYAFFGSGNIEKMSMQANDANGISLGKGWLPIKSNTVKTKIDIAWGCERT